MYVRLFIQGDSKVGQTSKANSPTTSELILPEQECWNVSTLSYKQLEMQVIFVN